MSQNGAIPMHLEGCCGEENNADGQVGTVVVLKEWPQRRRSPEQSRELVAQLVEQRPFKAWVLGSSPSELTTQPQSAIHGTNPGVRPKI
jgi:hypothetical protein